MISPTGLYSMALGTSGSLSAQESISGYMLSEASED
jgi:hypothetical protein